MVEEAEEKNFIDFRPVQTVYIRQATDGLLKYSNRT